MGSHCHEFETGQGSGAKRPPQQDGGYQGRKHGSRGTTCIVKANHFLVELPDKELHQYDVAITPVVTSRGVKRAILAQLVKLYRDSHLGKRLRAYDGRRMLFTAGPLPFSEKEFKITNVDEDDETGGARKEREFTVEIKLASRVDLHHLGMFLQGRQVDAPQEALQALDIVLRELPSNQYTPVGRSFYSSDIKYTLGGGLESWRGFYQSIQPTQKRLSLNIDVCLTAFIEPLPVIEFVSKLLNRNVSATFLSDAEHVKIKEALSGVKVIVTHRKNESTRHRISGLTSKPTRELKNVSATFLSDAEHVKIKEALSGVKVIVTHRKNESTRHRISGLTSKPTRELNFPADNKGTMKSVVEYFKETYGYSIQHIELPCLETKCTKRTHYLPMEVCKIVKGQRYSKRLNEGQTNTVCELTCSSPQKREESILETVKRYGEDPYAKEFGIKVSPDLAFLEARILPPPLLKYHHTGREKDCQPQFGEWNMTNKKLVNGGKVDSWICIDFAGILQIKVEAFCRRLVDVCNTLNMTFDHKPVLDPFSGCPDQVETVLKARFRDAMTILQPQKKELDLLLVILPENNGSLYGDVKRICETDLGIVSQCCQKKKAVSMITENLVSMVSMALKINVKVGGRNTVLVDALSRKIPKVSDVPTIIFGADVIHPPFGEYSRPSIAAVVASQDWPEITKYKGLVCAQAHGQEIIQDLYKEGRDPNKGKVSSGMIREHLMSFYTATGLQPQRIIFYRDGVREGRFSQALTDEVDAIRQACESINPNYKPKVTFVVARKRHNTKLFANNHKDLNSVDKSGNILPGTVVDSTICHPTEFDFYLCSHAGILGTNHPAHYHVLCDDNNFSADDMQSLTYNLCYTYARCPRSLSIVPPVRYAHLMATRAKFYMEPSTLNTRAGGRTRVRALAAIDEKVKRVMFYC